MAATAPFELKLWLSTPAGGPIEVGTITVDAHISLAGDVISFDGELIRHELALALHTAAAAFEPSV